MSTQSRIDYIPNAYTELQAKQDAAYERTKRNNERCIIGSLLLISFAAGLCIVGWAYCDTAKKWHSMKPQMMRCRKKGCGVEFDLNDPEKKAAGGLIYHCPEHSREVVEPLIATPVQAATAEELDATNFKIVPRSLSQRAELEAVSHE